MNLAPQYNFRIIVPECNFMIELRFCRTKTLLVDIWIRNIAVKINVGSATKQESKEKK